MILLGEMRDLETIATALTAAETGHLVFATLHTQSAPSTIDRVIDVFPAAQQDQVRMQLANSLQGVVTQTLLPKADGSGRVCALEILFLDDAIRNLIRQGKIEQIYSYMQTGTRRGMQTMEQSLMELDREATDHRSRSNRPLEPAGGPRVRTRAGRNPDPRDVHRRCTCIARARGGVAGRRELRAAMNPWNPTPPQTGLGRDRRRYVAAGARNRHPADLRVRWCFDDSRPSGRRDDRSGAHAAGPAARRGRP